jgi:hypothetical protein
MEELGYCFFNNLASSMVKCFFCVVVMGCFGVLLPAGGGVFLFSNSFKVFALGQWRSSMNMYISVGASFLWLKLKHEL